MASKKKSQRKSKPQAKSAKKLTKKVVAKAGKKPAPKVRKPKAPEAAAQAPANKEPKQKGPVFGDGTMPICEECGQRITQHLSTCPVLNPIVVKGDYSKEQLAAQQEARVCKDYNSRVCIELRRRAPESGGGEVGMKVVEFLLLDGEGPYTVKTMPAREFDKTYRQVYTYDRADGKMIGPYNVRQAARLFVGYAQHRGATERASEELAKLVNVSTKERETMAKKPSINTATKTGKKGAEGKEQMKSTKKGAAKAAKAPREKGERRSAASVAKELIMSGKLSDDKIFEKVHAEFPSFKRTYVAWYRNDLKKKGQKPPEKKAA